MRRTTTARRPGTSQAAAGRRAPGGRRRFRGIGARRRLRHGRERPAHRRPCCGGHGCRRGRDGDRAGDGEGRRTRDRGRVQRL